MARAARMVGGMKELAAVEIVYGAAYVWLREHGWSDPTLVDVATRVSENRHDQKQTLGRLVAEWDQYEAYTDEGDRRYAVSKRAFSKVRRMFGPQQ